MWSDVAIVGSGRSHGDDDAQTQPGGPDVALAAAPAIGWRRQADRCPPDAVHDHGRSAFGLPPAAARGADPGKP
jgi:hypothetical protein